LKKRVGKFFVNSPSNTKIVVYGCFQARCEVDDFGGISIRE